MRRDEDGEDMTEPESGDERCGMKAALESNLGFGVAGPRSICFKAVVIGSCALVL
jgi:hypothetical protein